MDSSTTALTLKQYVDAAFARKRDDEVVIFAHRKAGQDNPGLAYPHSRAMDRIIDRMTEDNARDMYISCATNFPQEGEVRNKDSHFGAQHVVVLDDIGSKYQGELPGILAEPSAVVETSPDNYQYHYFLAEPIYELDTAKAFTEMLYQAGEWDSGGALANKLVRYGVGYNTKECYNRPPVSIVEWNPDRRYLAEDLLAAAGVECDWEEVQEDGHAAARSRLVNQGVRTVPEDYQDPTLQWLADQALLLDDGRGEFFLIECPMGDQHSTGGTTAGYSPVGHGAIPDAGIFSCLHSCKTARGFDQAAFQAWVVGAGGPAAVESPLPDMVGIEMPAPANDNALLMATSTKKYSPAKVAGVMLLEIRGNYLQAVDPKGVGSWLAWDGFRWSRNQGLGLKALTGNRAQAIIPGDSAMSGRMGYINDVMTWMGCQEGMYELRSAFDRDNYLLCTPGGVLDLRTGEMLPPDPGQLITHQAGVAPVSGRPERFLRFMSEIFDGDQDTIDFMQRALGAILSGAVEEHWLMFWVGPGRNGKNTLGDLIQDIMGDYAGGIPSQALMSKRNKGHETEVMNMLGRRLVTASEIAAGSFWDEAMLKSITGDKWIMGRYMREDHTTFERTHKHLIYGNHPPRLRVTDIGMKSRMRIVPFEVSFKGREEKGLAERMFRQEGGQILQWLVDGHTMWLEGGNDIGTCPAVDQATDEYFKSQSTIENFIDECCEVDVKYKVHTAALYNMYLAWKDEMGERPKGKNSFSQELAGLGYTKDLQLVLDAVRGRGFRGLRLKFTDVSSIIPGIPSA